MGDMGQIRKDIYENGEIVGTLNGVYGSENIEEAVVRIARLGFAVDWHYYTGHSIIKTTSDVDEVRAAFKDNGYHIQELGG